MDDNHLHVYVLPDSDRVFVDELRLAEFVRYSLGICFNRKFDLQWGNYSQFGNGLRIYTYWIPVFDNNYQRDLMLLQLNHLCNDMLPPSFMRGTFRIFDHGHNLLFEGEQQPQEIQQFLQTHPLR